MIYWLPRLWPMYIEKKKMEKEREIDPREKNAIRDYVSLNSDNDDYYSNIFILLKILYLGNKCSKNENNCIYIPIEILKTSLKDLTFLSLMGYIENFAKISNNNNEGNMIITSREAVASFFACRNANAVDERKIIPIKDKFDLYISLLTYIYYYNSYKRINKEHHTDIVNRILFKLNKSSDNVIAMLLSSKIYNFKNIFSIDISPHKKMFVNDDDDKKNETILTYHLLLIHEFYDNYILPTLINNKKNICIKIIL